MNVLEATDVVRKYGAQTVLNGLSLSIVSGGFEALMGPSGSGKSTFLHLAAGLLSADSGSILVGGQNVVKMGDSTAAKFRRRHVGVVFQAFNLLNEKTVLENVLMPLRLDGRTDIGKAKGLLDRLGLADKADRRPEDLSGGEQQRVAIARALVVGPDIVLADEPTGNLDAASAKEVMTLLKDLMAHDPQTAVLVVTHDPMVAACATRVHFLKDGRIVASCETGGDVARVSQKYLETYR